MPFFYISFCDVTKPKGTQFLGATCVQAESAEHVQLELFFHGLNPGGEMAIVLLEGLGSIDDIPEEGRKYYYRFVSRDDVGIGVGLDPDAVIVCQACNPPPNANGDQIVH